MTDSPAQRATAPSSPETTAIRSAQRFGAKFANAAATTDDVRRTVPGNGGAPASTGPVVAGPRQARLRLTRVDPWSVMKMAFLLSIAIGVVTVVAVLIVWSVLSAAGVWDSINTAVKDIVGDSASSWNIQDYLGTSRVMGFTLVIAVVDVVLLTAVATLGAFLYNMAAALLGGVDVTLTEDN
ncbi:MAG: DUF3566 domain-containing protein [Nocardioides sp.]|uniref:DUF3566 domain-containing protein n=1 Tax=Nocardioides sp. TaxID=35761 RepID=UPI0039E3A9A0